MRLILILTVFSAAVCWCQGYKILAFFPFPGRSHHRVWDPLLKRLALDGHEVTAVKSFKMEDPPTSNYKEIAVKNVLPELVQMFGSGDSFSRPTFFGKLAMTLFFRSSALKMGELWMEDAGIREIINSNETYDAVLYESCLSQEFFAAFQHKFNAVGIEVSTVGNFQWLYWLLGNPIDTSYIPDSMAVDYSDHMTLLQKLHLTMLSSLVRFVNYAWYLPQYQRFMDENIRYPGWEDRPSLVDMVLNTSVVLVNVDVALAHPHPMSPNFIEVGGINVVPNKPLPTELQRYMDEAEEGVIFFTLGSHIQVSTTLGDSLRDVFSAVFSRLDQRVLWKWEKDNFRNLPKNVFISDWFPQQDILAHKNLKLFISHGGFLSMTEAIYFGSPVVGIPIFADQDRNVQYLQDKGIGIHLAFENLTEESVFWAVSQVLSRPSYKENALRQSRLLRDKPMTPLDKAVYWTEYAIRHKGAHHLKTAAVSMPWYQQAMLDVYFILALVILLPLYVVSKLCRCVFRRICKSSNGSNKIKKA